MLASRDAKSIHTDFVAKAVDRHVTAALLRRAEVDGARILVITDVQSEDATELRITHVDGADLSVAAGQLQVLTSAVRLKQIE